MNTKIIGSFNSGRTRGVRLLVEWGGKSYTFERVERIHDLPNLVNREAWLKSNLIREKTEVREQPYLGIVI